MERILRGAPAVISITFYDGETPTDSDEPVTLRLVADDGTELLPAGTPTVEIGGDTGRYTYTLTATETARVDILTAYWTAVIGAETVLTTQVEVVGAFYFSLTAGRASDPALADTAKYTTVQLADARDAAENECEEITGIAWVPRYKKATLSGTGSNELVLPDDIIRSVRSIAPAGGTAWTSPQLAAVRTTNSGLIVAGSGAPTFAYGSSNLVVAYEHGHDEAPPDIRRAALLRFKSFLLQSRSGIPDRAESFVAGEGGTFRLATPGRGGSETGIPEVDVVYARRRHLAVA